MLFKQTQKKFTIFSTSKTLKMFLIIAVVCSGFNVIVLTSPVSVKTYSDHLLVSWNPAPNPPQQWTITYQVMGTSYHSVLKVTGNRSTASINTVHYPGVLYAIKLFASNDGNETYYGTVFGRSDCSEQTDVTIGATYSLQSFGYPGGLVSGAICTWTFTGNNNTWFRFDLEDFDIGNSSCQSYLMVGKEKFCGNETINGTLLVYQPFFKVKLAYRDSSQNRGIKFHVSAIHKLLQPSNVTASYNGSCITVEWHQPSYHPRNFSYVIRISHFPFISHMDLALNGQVTRHVYHVINHLGQNFSVQLQSISEDLASAFTDPVFLSTNCDKDVHIKATEKYTVLSEQYPHSYLPKLLCNFWFQTEADFWLLIVTHEVDIGGEKMCDKTFIEIENLGKFCADAQPSSRMVIRNPSVNMVFKTSEEVYGKGINITVVSVAKAPSAPRNVLAESVNTSIHVAWKPPPSQQVYVKGYYVQYFIAPKTPGATLSVDKDVHNIFVNTQSHPGRLYAMRVAAFTDGGTGNFSQPFYIRAGCGQRTHLLRHESVVIVSPLNNQGHYEPDTLCQWVINTNSPQWIKITVNKFMLEDSFNCSKDYLTVTGTGRLCGVQEQRTTVIKETEVVVNFRTNSQNESKGFSITVEAVGPSPGQPSDVSVSQSGYAIFIQWKPPTLHKRFLTGYFVHFNFYGEKNETQRRVGPDTSLYVLDMTADPGKLMQIRLRAEGDVEHSNATETLFIRTECGHTVEVSSPTYIASPYYGNSENVNIQCLWKLKIPKKLHLKIDFIRLNLNNMQTCGNYILVNNKSRYCDDSFENKSDVINSTMFVTLVWHTGPAGKGAYFLLRVEPVAEPRPTSVTSRPVSSCVDMVCSSTSLLMTSYFGTLLASTIVVSTALSAHYNDVTEESPVGTKALQSAFTSTHHETTADSKFVVLQKTMLTDVDKTHSNKNWFALRTDIIQKTENTVIDNHRSSCPEKESTKDYFISPTRASSFLVSAYTETLLSGSLNSSSKQMSFLSKNTKIIKSVYSWENLSPTAASTFRSINVINNDPTGVSKTLHCKNISNNAKSVSSTKDFTYKITQRSSTLQPSVSALSDVSTIPVENVDKGMLTFTKLEMKHNVEPTKETGQMRRNASNGKDGFHFLLLGMCICVIFFSVLS